MQRPRRSWPYRYRRRPPPPPPLYEESIVEYGDVPPPEPPVPAPWARTVWFWLLLLGVVAILIALIALVAATDDAGRNERRGLPDATFRAGS